MSRKQRAVWSILWMLCGIAAGTAVLYIAATGA